VGRVDVPVSPGFAGTCFAIAEGLVLTNRHVLEAIATQNADRTWSLKWPDATTIDFYGEDDQDLSSTTKFKLIGAAFAAPDPINHVVNFAHLDMAVLRVDQASSQPILFPEPVMFESNPAEPQAPRDLYVVGFPGKPATWVFGGTPPAGHEITQV